jgi:hypothetical protein
LQGLKPEVDLIGFIGPAEAVPLLQSLREWTIRRVFHQAVKSCPFKELNPRRGFAGLMETLQGSLCCLWINILFLFALSSEFALC